MSQIEHIKQLAEQLPPITLDEMKSIRLMNRMDTKFVTNTETLIELLKLAKGLYYSQCIDGSRISSYRTQYWDDLGEHKMFHTHLCGHLPRTKVRVRTYVGSDQSFLEIKKKNNHGKTKKKRITVPSLDAVINDHYGEEFLQELTDFSFDQIQPTLCNEFKRITLVNYNKTERLTIDFDIHFHNKETGRSAENDHVVIIELKRDGRIPSPILPLLRQLRVKPSGFSKYCIGTVVTNSEIKQNRFKKRLAKVMKLIEKPLPSSFLENQQQ